MRDPASLRSAAMRAVLRDPPNLMTYQFNDHGNAERMIALHGPDMRFCYAIKNWLIYDGMRWALDEAGRAFKIAKETMIEFYRQASQAGNREAEGFSRRSLESRRIMSMLVMAQCELVVQPRDLDSDPYLLNFTNGTVDLRTGQLQGHRRTDFITKLILYRYDQASKCPRWLAFLDQIMGGGPDAGEAELARAERLIEYLQRAFGYSLTGCTSEKAVFIPFGDGDNGKSTLLSTISRLAEEYAVLLQVDTLMVRQESNNTQADLADLRGARFVQTSETEEGQRLAQGKLKRITQGMGKIKATRKYENPIEFPETHKLWIDTNRKPTIRDADDKATFNRLHPIPFTIKIPADRIDKMLPEKLLGEAEGILAWLVAGAKAWCEVGLMKPLEVRVANEQWRSESDKLARFIEECCIAADTLSIPTSRLYARYKAWAESGSEAPMTATEFGVKLAGKGCTKKHKNTGDVFLGIGLRAEPGMEER